MATESKKETASTKADAPDLESVMNVLHSDVADVDAGTAIDSIDGWVDYLKGHKDDGVKKLSASLKDLKKLLKGQKTEALDIVSALSRLGEQTSALGDSAERGVKGPLHLLGKTLISFSYKIEKMADKASKED